MGVGVEREAVQTGRGAERDVRVYQPHHSAREELQFLRFVKTQP